MLSIDRAVLVGEVTCAYAGIGVSGGLTTIAGTSYVEYRREDDLLFHPVIEGNYVDLDDLIRDCTGYDPEIARQLTVALLGNRGKPQ